MLRNVTSIKDIDAYEVSKQFYPDFFSGGAKAEDAAITLHNVIWKLRELGWGHQSWVPFVHFGA